MYYRCTVRNFANKWHNITFIKSPDCCFIDSGGSAGDFSFWIWMDKEALNIDIWGIEYN